MKKLMIIIIIFIMFLILNNIKKEENYKEFSIETQNWIKWYNSLSEEEKSKISYVPYEIIEAIDNGYEFKIMK